MERLEAFEKMLDDRKVQAAYEENQMEQLKAAVSRCPRNIHVGHQELAACLSTERLPSVLADGLP